MPVKEPDPAWASTWVKGPVRVTSHGSCVTTRQGAGEGTSPRDILRILRGHPRRNRIRRIWCSHQASEETSPCSSKGTGPRDYHAGDGTGSVGSSMATKPAKGPVRVPAKGRRRDPGSASSDVAIKQAKGPVCVPENVDRGTARDELRRNERYNNRNYASICLRDDARQGTARVKVQRNYQRVIAQGTD